MFVAGIICFTRPTLLYGSRKKKLVRLWLINLSNRLSAVSLFCGLPPLVLRTREWEEFVFLAPFAMAANSGNLPIQDGSEVPLPIVISTPGNSPRSRSGHSAHDLLQIETHNSASQDGGSTVMYVDEAAREGEPRPVALNQMNQMNLYQQFQRNEYAYNPTLQALHITTHDPAITSLVEETAERRHREVMGQTELEARRLQEALMHQEREEIARTRQAVGQEAAEYRQKCNQEAEFEIHRRQASANNTIEEYKRVMDQNLRQSISNKDREIQQLRDEALVRDQHQNAKIQELQNMVQQQAAANQKLQQLLESSLRIPSNVHQVQSETADPIGSQTAKASAVVPPPGIAPIGLANVHGFQHSLPMPSGSSVDPVVIRDPVTGVPVLVSKQNPSVNPEKSPGRSLRNVLREDDQPEPTTPNQSPVPSIRHYAMFPSGGGGGGGGGGGDGNGDGNDGPNEPFDLFGFPAYPTPTDPGRHQRRRHGAPDGGGGGGPGGSDSEDSDDKFARKLKKFLKSSREPDEHDDKPKVKEADTVKVPAFPTPESYRNWRIKTREAVVAASTKPDEAFRWVNEAWKEGQSLEALRKVEPFATLDAKLMSALTNIITGHFARIVDTFKENEASQDRIVRGRQILFMLHDHFSTNIKHGATYALEDLFSITLRNDNLRVFMSSWDQVLAGITNVPDKSVLETLFYKQVKHSRSISHDLNEYHRAEEGNEKHSYEFLLSAVRRHLDRERLESNRDRVARNLAGTQRASTPAVGGEKKPYIPKGFCIKWNRGGCSDDQCKFKHETPQPRPPRRGRDQSRESSRGRSPSGRGDKSRVCKFWKQGRCNRGDDCKFKHEGKPGKPRRATPARSGSNDSKGSGKGRRRKSRSTSRSKSPKSPKSPKGSPRSKAAAAP